MINKEPINQTKLYGLNNFIKELIQLEQKNALPNKILLSGQKGIGKSTLAYHFINYVLSKNEEFKYNVDDLEINTKCEKLSTYVHANKILDEFLPLFMFDDVDKRKTFIQSNAKKVVNLDV